MHFVDATSAVVANTAGAEDEQGEQLDEAPVRTVEVAGEVHPDVLAEHYYVHDDMDSFQDSQLVSEHDHWDTWELAVRRRVLLAVEEYRLVVPEGQLQPCLLTAEEQDVVQVLESPLEFPLLPILVAVAR